jgi:hypothetical protein
MRNTQQLTGRETMITQLEQLADEFGAMDTIPVGHADKLIAIMDKAPREALEMLAERNVKFLAPLARIRLERMALTSGHKGT